MKNKIFLLFILGIASFFRLFGVNWDQGYHLHPDERFLTMVATAIKIPATIGNYLNPQISTMSPYNNNFNFFVYGTFPLNIVKVAGELIGRNTYDTIHLLGRQFSAFFDIGVVLLVFLIGRKLWSVKTGLWSAFLYSVMVLPIQLSHFFAVDTFLNFFIVLSFYFLVHLLTSHSLYTVNSAHEIYGDFSTHISLPTSHFLTASALGLSFGFALACKISAIYFAPIIALGFLHLFIKTIKSKQILLFTVYCLLFTLFCLISFRLGHPTAFATGDLLNWQPNPKFIANINELKGYNSPDNWFPPSVQWKSVKPILFPFGNIITWGLGLPLGLIAISSILYIIFRLFKIINFKLRGLQTGINPTHGTHGTRDTHGTSNTFCASLMVLWILGFFLYQGTQSVTTMRYFLPIYPFLALISGVFIANYLIPKINLGNKLISICLQTTVYGLLLIYPISFLSIYSRPITRLTASEWIYKNIPAGSTILNEEWDDALPLGIAPNYNWNSAGYNGISVFMYDEDTPEKWARIQPKIDQADYYITSSNRAYGGLMRLPKRNPDTIKFYQGLFNSSGDFNKVAEFTSRPCFPPFGNNPLFCYNDDDAEENFTVFDHPKVMVFERNRAGE